MCYCLSFEKCIGYVKVTATTHVIDIVDQLLTRHSLFRATQSGKVSNMLNLTWLFVGIYSDYGC